MRIGLNIPDPQATSTEQANRSSTSAANRAETTPATGKNSAAQDRVTLSALASQALGLPEVRQDKVEGLRQNIDRGQYLLEPDQLADAILRGNQRLR